MRGEIDVVVHAYGQGERQGGSGGGDKGGREGGSEGRRVSLAGTSNPTISSAERGFAHKAIDPSQHAPLSGGDAFPFFYSSSKPTSFPPSLNPSFPPSRPLLAIHAVPACAPAHLPPFLPHHLRCAQGCSCWRRAPPSLSSPERGAWPSPSGGDARLRLREWGRGGGKEGKREGQGRESRIRTCEQLGRLMIGVAFLQLLPSPHPNRSIALQTLPPSPPPLLPPLLLLTLPFPLPLPPLLVEAVSQDLGHAQVKLEPAQRGVPGLRKGEREGGKEGLSHDMNEQSDWKSTGAISPSVLKQTSFRHCVGKALPLSLR